MTLSSKKLPPKAGKADSRTQTFASFSRQLLDDDLRDLLTDWEIEYLSSWVKKSFTPSPKQLAIFERISKKTGIPLPDYPPTPEQKPPWEEI